MAKIVKKKNQKRLNAKKDGLTPHLRKVIADGEKSLKEGTAKTVTVQEIMSFLRSLHD